MKSQGASSETPAIVSRTPPPALRATSPASGEEGSCRSFGHRRRHRISHNVDLGIRDDIALSRKHSFYFGDSYVLGNGFGFSLNTWNRDGEFGRVRDGRDRKAAVRKPVEHGSVSVSYTHLTL